jgi:hypothetical protein
MTNRLFTVAMLLLVLPVGNLALATPENTATATQQGDTPHAVQPVIARPARSLAAAWAAGAALAGVCILLIILVWKGYLHPSILDEHRRI